ncbi:MAG: hypothetical protein ACFNL0_05745 [Haemophilus seminalis]
MTELGVRVNPADVIVQVDFERSNY